MSFRGSVTVAPVTLDHFVWVRILVPELLPCSTMVVRFAVNEGVVGSSPTGAVYKEVPV